MSVASSVSRSIREPRVERRLHDAAGVLETVDAGLGGVAGAHRPQVAGHLQPERCASSTIGRSTSTGIISRTLIAIAPPSWRMRTTRRAMSSLSIPMKWSRRGGGMSSPLPVKKIRGPMAAAGLDLVARRGDPGDVVADVLDGGDAVGEEQLAHPFEVVHVDVDQPRQHEPAVTVDHRRTGGTLDRADGTDRRDPLTGDHDVDAGRRRPASPVDHGGAAEHGARRVDPAPYWLVHARGVY